MACGTPMISFKVGGVPDLVRPGVTGYLANSENIDDFRNGIIELLENQCLRNQLAENCRRVAVSEYSLELQVKRYMQLYDQVLHSK
jgi:glycosyltransferase involved in cell wall biosynthesis